MDCNEEDLQALYTWVDNIPLSRPKRSIARDFADGVLLAEVVHHYFPKLVELHNFSGAHGLAQKLYNWSTLNQRVFRRLGFVVAKAECEGVALCEPGAVERVLKLVRVHIADHAERQRQQVSEPAVPAHGAASQSCPQCGSGADASQPRTCEAHSLRAPALAAVPPGLPSAGACAHVTLRAGSSTGRLKAVHKGGGAPAEARVGGAAAEAAGAVCGGQGGVPARWPEAAEELHHALLELQETRELNEILEAKTRKLEQLLRLKDAKIDALEARLRAAQLG